MMASKAADKKTKKTAPAKSAKAAPRRKTTAKAPKAKPAKKAAPAAKKAAASSAPKAASKKPAAKKKTAKPEASVAADKKVKTAKKAPAKKAAPPAKPKTKTAKTAAPKAAPQKTAAKAKTKAAEKPVKKETAAQKKAAKKKADAAAKAVPKKKQHVGQKPRSPKASDSLEIKPPPKPQRPPSPVKESPVKASPASAEAKQDFKVNDSIVYPAHGVGRIVSIEKQSIAGINNELFLIDFEQEKMKLRVPTAKAKAVGMRPLSDGPLIKKAIETLKGRARVKRTMWSRRAQEYEAKINSGDIISVAEVVRDLYRASDQPEQSYSERQLFEAALDRLAREVAAVHKTDMAGAIGELEASLHQKKAA